MSSAALNPFFSVQKVNFADDIEGMMGFIYKDSIENALVWDVSTSVFSIDEEDIHAGLAVFLEMVMGHELEMLRINANLNENTLSLSKFEYPHHEIIHGKAHLVHNARNVFFVKARLYAGDQILLEGTALWDRD